MQTSLSRLQLKTFLTFKKAVKTTVNSHLSGPAFTLVTLYIHKREKHWVFSELHLLLQNAATWSILLYSYHKTSNQL